MVVFYSHLDIPVPRAARQVALRLQLCKLRRVICVCAPQEPRSMPKLTPVLHPPKHSACLPVGVYCHAPAGRLLWRRWLRKGLLGRSGSSTCYAAWPEAVADGEGDVVGGADVQDLVPVHEGKVLGVVQQAQLRQQGTPAAASDTLQT